ncbi:MAG TPA: hypothetical protein PLY09_01265 [Methanothrix sp.]|nr:hypothetical protein [Methanothrix sp.]HPJ83374.1 hypothetical protein [Methanothrix sp.]
MRKAVTFGGALILLLLLAGLSAVGDDLESAADVEDPWAAIDSSLIASKVEVKDISGKYADLTQGVAVGTEGNATEEYPYQEECVWTIEQHGSLLVADMECAEGGPYQVVGSTSMDEVHIYYIGPETVDGMNVTVEGILDGEILESGEIVMNGVGAAYDADLNEVYYFAETTVLTPIEE